MTQQQVLDVVISAIGSLNMARTPDKRLETTVTAVIFGEGSPLDSLGLVALLIDVEDALSEHGVELNLSDAHAMSLTRSPFRSVGTLAAYISDRLEAAP